MSAIDIVKRQIVTRSGLENYLYQKRQELELSTDPYKVPQSHLVTLMLDKST